MKTILDVARIIGAVTCFTSGFLLLVIALAVLLYDREGFWWGAGCVLFLAIGSGLVYLGVTLTLA